MIFGRNSRFGDSRVSIPGNVSSQYISALLMIAPTLPDGLQIDIEGEIGSRPYIEMTLGLMKRFGIRYRWEGSSILVERALYQPGTYAVEADWSAASYWYTIAAMADEVEISLPGLRKESLQGDHVVAEMMAPLGVDTVFNESGVILKKASVRMPDAVIWDFRACPDLAQGLLVMLARLGIQGPFTGLESLALQETGSLRALANELGQFGRAIAWKTPGVELGGNFMVDRLQFHYQIIGLACFCPLVEVSD